MSAEHEAREPCRLRTIEVAGFAFTEAVHSAGSHLPWHSHERPTICFVLDGAFVEGCAGTATLCVPTTLKFMPAGERHYDDFDRGAARGLMIEIQSDRFELWKPYAAILRERMHCHGGPLAEIALRVHSELCRMDDTAPLVIEGLMLELLAFKSRHGPRRDRLIPGWLERARCLIEDQIAGPLTLSGIAQAIGVHPVTLARTFRRGFGTTVGEYVRQRRVERAMQQLRQTREPLASIALSNGFADQSHFCNLFRRYAGTTPSNFRRQAKP